MRRHHLWASASIGILLYLVLGIGGLSLGNDTPVGTMRTYYVADDGPGMARVYRKAVYRLYTDSTFRTPSPRPPAWDHLSLLGPVLRAEVGDTLRVVFRNNTRYAFSIHPHGVFYTKANEGALYNDGTAGADKQDDPVPPGGTFTYAWPVPERAGAGRPEHDPLGVSLAHPRMARRQRRPHRPHHHRPARRLRPGRDTARRRPRVRDALRRVRREREPLHPG